MMSYCQEDALGNKRWYKDYHYHRLDGPAIEHTNGFKVWYVNGKLHRLDGPAVEYDDGSKEWWADDKYLGNNSEGFWALWTLLTDEQRADLNLHMHLPGAVR